MRSASISTHTQRHKGFHASAAIVVWLTSAIHCEVIGSSLAADRIEDWICCMSGNAYIQAKSALVTKIYSLCKKQYKPLNKFLQGYEVIVELHQSIF